MQVAITSDEQQLIDRLREKYGGVRNAEMSACSQAGASWGHAAQPLADTERSTRPDNHRNRIGLQEEESCTTYVAGSQANHGLGPRPRPSGGPSDVEASVCPHCHGTGTLVEIYNHRRLETYCKACEGRGVHVFRNGVEVNSGASAGVTVTSGNVPAPAGVVALRDSVATRKAARVGGQDSSGSDGEPGSSSERIGALQWELQRLAAKAAAYAKERMEALAVLQQPARGTDPSGRDAAARDLVAQLDLQLERMELARRKKQAALERQQKAATRVTLDDIIANEAPGA